MAEFLTMDEAKSKFGTKGRTNAGLTLGIIGTALAAFAGNNGGCGCGNGGGILGNLFVTCTLTLTAVLWLLTRESVTSLKF